MGAKSRLSLAHLTVLDADPLQLIDAAVAGGFDAIGLRIVALPLGELLDALPEGIPLGVEAPCMQYANLSPVEGGRLCGAATRAFIERHQAMPRRL